MIRASSQSSLTYTLTSHDKDYYIRRSLYKLIKNITVCRDMLHLMTNDWRRSTSLFLTEHI